MEKLVRSQGTMTAQRRNNHLAFVASFTKRLQQQTIRLVCPSQSWDVNHSLEKQNFHVVAKIMLSLPKHVPRQTQAGLLFLCGAIFQTRQLRLAPTTGLAISGIFPF